MSVMKLWSAFWAYWKWFCTALVTSTLVLLLVATLVQHFKPVGEDLQKRIEECIDKGGTWDADALTCKTQA